MAYEAGLVELGKWPALASRPQGIQAGGQFPRFGAFDLIGLDYFRLNDQNHQHEIWGHHGKKDRNPVWHRSGAG